MINIRNLDCKVLMEEYISKGIKVDCIITDPPYEIEIGCRGINSKRNVMQLLGSMSKGVGEEYLDLMVKMQEKINMYIFCSQTQMIKFIDYFTTKHKCMYTILTWHKTNAIPAFNNKYLPDTEFILFVRGRGVKLNKGIYEMRRSYYLSSNNITDKKRYYHPTVKPLDLITKFVINSTAEGDTIFDPFMGTGTTGVVAHKLVRNFIGCEIDTNFFTTAKRRFWEESCEVSLS